MTDPIKRISWTLLASLVLVACTSGCFSALNNAPVDVDLQELNIDSSDAAERNVVVLKFGATWCPPCRMIDKELDRLRETHGGSVIVKTIDVDDNRSLGRKFGVSGIPRVFLIKDGKRIDDVTGYRSHDDLVAWVEDAGASPAPGTSGEVIINTLGGSKSTSTPTVRPTSLRPTSNQNNGPGSIKTNPYL